MTHSADYDALADEVVDRVLAHQGQGIGGPHGAVREAIMRVFPPGAETDQSDTEQHTTSPIPPGQ